MSFPLAPLILEVFMNLLTSACMLTQYVRHWHRYIYNVLCLVFYQYKVFKEDNEHENLRLEDDDAYHDDNKVESKYNEEEGAEKIGIIGNEVKEHKLTEGCLAKQYAGQTHL